MKIQSLTLPALAGALLVFGAHGQTVIEDFEYASNDDLYANWTTDSGFVQLSDNVAANSTGTNSLEIYRYFGASPWETQIVSGPVLDTPTAIVPGQYISFRLAGDPQFQNGTFSQLYVYVYDSQGNFGRWGTAIPTSTSWQTVNLLANNIELPWNSPGAPNQSDIVQFKVVIYGQGDPAGQPFDATIRLDDLTVRDTPLIDFPPAAPMRALIDDFEGYTDDAALHAFYSILNSPATTATSASLESPAPQGNQALKLAIDFASGRYPWGAVMSAEVAPFSLPTNAVVQFRVKGDPSLEPVVDDGTVFYLSFYDSAGAAIHYTATPPVVAADWQWVQAPAGWFWQQSIVDTGNLVRWRILVEGWNGTDESPGRSGTFYVDDIRITVPPRLAITSAGDHLNLHLSDLLPGTTYTLRQTSDFNTWTTSTFTATADTETRSLTPDGHVFYQLYYTP